ncbi:MAG TPA: biotin--[acetyl-CoA-carboxylase] ligase [Gammaproteobacteria bacterium]
MSHASTPAPASFADRLDADRILAALAPAAARRVERLDVFASLDSTNRYLLEAPPPARGALDVAIADHQHAGRGRRGRCWTAPPGTCLCLSAATRTARAARELAALPLAAGVAARRAVRTACGVDVGLKWPNDLTWRGRKLGGILVEHKAGGAGDAHVVIGIGINVAVPPAELGRLSDWPAGAVDLATATGGRPTARVTLAAALVDELVALVETFEQDGFAAFRDAFTAADVLLGREVIVDDGRTRSAGIARGVDADGALVVEAADGSRRRVLAGDVSIRAAAESGASA